MKYETKMKVLEASWPWFCLAALHL